MDKQELKGGHYIVGNLKYDTEGAMLFDENNNLIADIRGYGRVGSSGQDQIGELLVRAWNTSTPSLDDVLGEVLEQAKERYGVDPMFLNEYIEIENLEQIINEIKERYGKST